MRWKQNSLLILLLGWSVLTLGQKLQWSETHEIPEDTYIKTIIGEKEAGHLFVLRAKTGGRFSTGEYWIEKHNSDMSRAHSKPLNIPMERNVPHRLERVVLLDEKLVLFTSCFQKANRANVAYATVISEDGLLLEEPQALDTIRVDKVGNQGEFKFRLSEDGGRVLLLRTEPYEKFTTERFHLKVINHDLSIAWGQNFNLEYKNREFDVESVRLDEQTNVHMLARINNTDGAPKPGQPNFHYTLFSYDRASNNLREYEIKLPNRAVSDITFKVSNDGDLLAAGFYSNQTDGEAYVGGTFFLRINPSSGAVVAKGIKDFEKSFVSKFIGDRKADRGNELYNYAIDHFITKEDGGFMIIGEQIVKSVSCYTDPRTGFENCNDNYYYNDIIVVNFDSTGAIQWARQVPKRQHSINDNGFFSSYLRSYHNGRLHLAFNENPVNMKVAEGERPKPMTGLRKSIVAQVTIDEKGNMTKKQLFSNKDRSINLRPKIHRQGRDNAVIIYGQRKRNYQFGRLVFE